MHLFDRCRAAARTHPYWADGLMAVVLYAVTMFNLPLDPVLREWSGLHPRLVLGVAGVPVFLPLVWRRRYPVAVLAVTVAATIGYMVIGPVRGPILLGATVAVYTVCATVERRLAQAVGWLSVLALGITSWDRSTEAWNKSVNAIVFAWIALAVAVGEAVRSRRAFVAAIEERALRAEHTREQEARRRVAEERMRIARELHDIVGHHIALINIQAGVASHLLDSRPDQARAALAHVREAGRSALSELNATVSVLRQGDETDAPTEPTPGLHQLDALLESFDRAGLHVDRVEEGEPTNVPTAVDLTAYRIVQESLTNVRKHAGTSSASLRLTYRRDGLGIEVEDSGPGAAEPVGGSGYGLIGMRERAASVGGTFRAGPGADGGFRVRVELPLARVPRPAGSRDGGSGANSTSTSTSTTATANAVRSTANGYV
ncbi:sensor histidine kinase [Streptacidiphilus albus]|uniref:sensor histidine kinase n=1 Tax=Streptacidiphilus albus TaxID=105425 RepID=UPI00068FBFC8|nr:sensor histidine kinase [Streptacidiphilus albus]